MKKFFSNKLYAAFLLPALLIFTVFVIAPAFALIPISLQKHNGIVSQGWVMLENFKEVLKDKSFWGAHVNLLKMFAVNILTYPIGWSLAFKLNRTSGWVNKVFRFAALFPTILAITTVAKLGAGIFNSNWGLVNSFLNSIGLGKLTHSWLSEKGTAMWCVSLISVWWTLGCGVIVKYAAIRGISPCYVEAAKLDGCTSRQADWKIYFPLLRNILQYEIITNVVGTLCTYAIVVIIGGKTAGSLMETPITMIVDTSFARMKFGLGCAMALVFFVECVLVSMIVTKLTDWETYEY